MHFRMTRRDPYPKGSPGHDEVSARQGYYLHVENETAAKVIMAQKFPDDQQGFDCQLWE